MDTDTVRDEVLILRRPCANDGAQIHALIAACPPLDTNTVYAYLLLAQYFQDTCIVACRQEEDDLAGFISGFIVPQRADTLFIWQVAVHPSQRGRGLAATMLDRLLQEQISRGVRFIETTVSPDNQGSRALFNALARRRGAVLSETPMFDRSLFGGQSHEDEPLLRLGPFQ
ncbi:diaminobutyrate acetyltransferase [Paracandidimonas soli]|uniref:diaminobutyrate acetyltransferase n=1 Tax=Paracandidimonas soli TaxID=1917182 RepID=UPI00334170AF